MSQRISTFRLLHFNRQEDPDLSLKICSRLPRVLAIGLGIYALIVLGPLFKDVPKFWPDMKASFQVSFWLAFLITIYNFHLIIDLDTHALPFIDLALGFLVLLSFFWLLMASETYRSACKLSYSGSAQSATSNSDAELCAKLNMKRISWYLGLMGGMFLTAAVKLIITYVYYSNVLIYDILDPIYRPRSKKIFGL